MQWRWLRPLAVNGVGLMFRSGPGAAFQPRHSPAWMNMLQAGFISPIAGRAFIAVVENERQRRSVRHSVPCSQM